MILITCKLVRALERRGFSYTKTRYSPAADYFFNVALRLHEKVIGGGKRETWLILPVVICLSQRLSHACLSISLYTAKLRKAH